MKIKPGLVILVLAGGGMMAALFAVKKTADDRINRNVDAILDFSNRLMAARSSLDELGQVNLRLTNDLMTSRQEMLNFSNRLAEASDILTATRGSLQSAQDRIAGLIAQNQVLDRRAAAWSNTFNVQIAETRLRFAESETNNTFLERELLQQTAARTELEGKFNDLTAIRTQVKKLKEDLVTSRRLQWMRTGTDPGLPQIKDGQRQIQGKTPTFASASRYDLNVEIGSDGAIRVMPATTTNALVPAGNPLPP